MKLLQKNSVGFGVLMGVLGPATALGLLYLINLLLVQGFNEGAEVLRFDTMIITSLFMNLFIFLPYLRKDKYERTGRGILLVTFTGVVVYFMTLL